MQVDLYRRNRARIPMEELKPHAGRWAAFSADGTRLIAVADDLESLDRCIRDASEDPEQAAIERIVLEDDWAGAVELE
jgi:hypothetical protein